MKDNKTHEGLFASHGLAVAAIAAAIVAIVVYYSFSPGTSAFFPQCVFHRATGLLCPSCGNQRALHALLHGDIHAAAHYNLFFLICLPYALGVLAATIFTNPTAVRWRRTLLSGLTVRIYIALYLLWGVIRNVFECFAL